MLTGRLVIAMYGGHGITWEVPVRVKPAYHFDEHAGQHVWTFEDTTVLRVSPGRSDGRGGLLARVYAYVGDIPLNHARINLVNQDDLAKFNHNTLARTASLNGDIPNDAAKHADWFGRLIDSLPTVEVAPESPSARITLTRLGDLLTEPDTKVEWVVDDLLPAGGFATLTAKPKVGKSTLARHLALSIATGRPFLGRSTAQGAVIYLALEEKRSEVRKHFRAMGATGEEEIYIYTATAPADALAQIREVLESRKPALLIIDPLFRFTRIKEGNDYAQVTQALEPLVALARETGTHVLCVHHEGKGDRQGGDAILGSTAIFGAVDTAISMKRTERYRTISSVQRYGEDLEETTLQFDPVTRITTLGETKEREEEMRIGEGIIAYLRAKTDPVTEAEIDSDVEGKTRIRRKALRDLLAVGGIIRSGKGGKSDPFRYSIGGTHPNERGNKNPSEETQANSGSSAEPTNVVPLFPHISREQENTNPKADVSDQKQEPYSCSRGFDKGPDFQHDLISAGNKNLPDHITRCAGCREPFTPGQDGATMTVCSECATELKRRG
jgi:AAA domain